MLYILCLVVGFLVGVFVGRTNKNRVEKAYQALKQEYELIKEKVEK